MGTTAERQHETEAKTAFEGGATRSQKSERFDLIPAEAELATARRFGLGAAKHGDRNWQNGGADFILATINHLQAHLNSIKQGSPSSDDDIGAVLCNASMLAWFRQRKAGEFCKAMDAIAGGSDDVIRAILAAPVNSVSGTFTLKTSPMKAPTDDPAEYRRI